VSIKYGHMKDSSSYLSLGPEKLDPNNMDPNYLGPRRMSFRFGELCCAVQLS
jgi:hypothetical protein